MEYWAKDIYSWGIFSAEVYPRSSIAIQRTVQMSWISCPLDDLQMGQHTLDDRNQGHHTTLLLSETQLSTAQASLCVGEVRSLESTGSCDMSRCLRSSGQHLVDGEGSSGSSSGSSRIVPPPTPQTNHSHGYSSVSLTDWPAAGVTRSGRRIHRTWTPQIFICEDIFKKGCMATTPRLSLTWRQQSQQQ